MDWMIGRRAAVALAAALMACGTGMALAADPAELDCPAARMTAEEQAAFASYLADGAVDRGDSRFVAFRQVVDDCAETLAWPQPVAELAFRFHVSALAQAENRRRLEAVGFNVAPVERAILADRELLAASASGPYPEREMDAFLDRLEPAVEGQLSRDPTGRATENLGMFIMFRATMEATRSAFARD